MGANLGFDAALAGDSSRAAALPHHTVEGEMSLAVRLTGVVMATLLASAVILGTWRALGGPHYGKAALVDGLYLAQIILAGTLILLGSTVEGFGYGLSLGTRWPYTRNILVLMWHGDPEAAHRVVATLVGLVALALAVLAPGSDTFSGLSLVVATALFGMGTLYVLAGKMPALMHGTHGLLAYAVLLVYLTGMAYPGMDFWAYLRATSALHPLLLTIFLGGMTTGQRGFGQPIGAFYRPRRKAHWVVAAHVVAALSIVATLGWLMPAYPVAFYVALAQISVGFLLFQAVNLAPKHPGAIVPFHQLAVFLITCAIVFQWR